MTLIKWSDTLSVQVDEIDKQHQKLIKLINDLNDAMMHGKAKEVAGDIIKELADYTVTHFSWEEKYFEKFNYVDTPAHKKEHADFVAKVSKFQEDYNKGAVTLNIELMNFLSDWLRHHIMGTDKKYISFFHDHGIK